MPDDVVTGPLGAHPPPRDPRSDPELRRRILLARKVGPRLAWLHSLPTEELRNLKRWEDARVREFAEDIRFVTRDLSDRHAATTARERLRSLRQRRFAPITTGVYFPDDPYSPPRWSVGFQGPYISCLVVSRVNAQDLDGLGVRVRCQAGDVFTALISMSAIGALAESPVIRRIELAHAFFPDLDTALHCAQIDVLHDEGHDGSGIVIGVIDDGIDLEHPDFQEEGGGPVSTRILYLWDQTLPTTAIDLPPPESPTLPGFQYTDHASYGVEFDRDAINDWLRMTGDRPVGHIPGSHGTIVTGCAAGNGQVFAQLQAADPGHPSLVESGAPSAPPKGSAPKAEIIFVAQKGVAGESSLADSAAVMDAFAYIFARASSLPVPKACVVNMSQSDNQGGHDGRSSGERFLNNLLSTHTGRAITLSAGNANVTSSHASGSVPAGGSTQLKLLYFASGGAPTNPDAVEIWYSSADRLKTDLTVPVPDPVAGTSTTKISRVLLADDSLENTFGNVKVILDSVVGVADNGDNQIKIQIVPVLLPDGSVPSNWAIPQGDWVIDLIADVVGGSSASFHAWLDRNNEGRAVWRAASGLGTAGWVNNEYTISVPGTAELPITVAAHDEVVPPTLSPLKTAWSGRGPTRLLAATSPADKPDISTVGTSMVTPFPLDHPDTRAGYPYAKADGTSVSAPIVAGTCALVFECHGGQTLPSASLKSLVLGAAVPHGNAKEFGKGYLQAGALCEPPEIEFDYSLWSDAFDTLSPFAWWRPPPFELKEVINLEDLPHVDPPWPEAHQIDLTVHNRREAALEGASVELYWAAPTTTFSFPGQWSEKGFFRIEDSKAVAGNRVGLPAIAAGKSAPLRVFWSAGDEKWHGRRKGDAPCILARVLPPGGSKRESWEAMPIKARVGARSVVQRVIERGKPVEIGFRISGSGGHESLHVISHLAGGKIVLELPVRALPWRSLEWFEKNGGPLMPWTDRKQGTVPSTRSVLQRREAQLISGIEGHEFLSVKDGIATIVMAGDPKHRTMILQELCMAPRADPLEVVLRVEGAKISERSHAVHLVQISRGRRMGGLTLDLSAAPR